MRIRAQPSRSHAESAATAANGYVRLLGELCLPLLFLIMSARCGGANLFRPYEYEEEIYLSLDGSAIIYVNASIPALNALRGTSFDQNPTARVDRDAVRRYFSSPTTHAAPVRTSRRSGRRFVHVRLDADDIRTLGAVQPFAWSSYQFHRVGDEFVFEQKIQGAAVKDVGNVGWRDRDLVAFRVHLPSKITSDNTRRDIGRGNILVWEQPLSERLRGAPLTLQASMQTQSILYRTLWIFGATLASVTVLFTAIIWWVLRRGRTAQHAI